MSRWRRLLFATTTAGNLRSSSPALPDRRTLAVRIGGQAQDRPRMTPFAVEHVWHAGRPVRVAEKGSTLALLLEATVRRITAAAASDAGCPCCRCSIRIRRTADLQSVTVAVAQSDVEEFRILARVYCARCVPDPDAADAMAVCAHGAITMRFRICVPPSTAWKRARKQPAGHAA
jgi:hypothetical protein